MASATDSTTTPAYCLRPPAAALLSVGRVGAQLFEHLVHAMIPETVFHLLQLGCPPLHFAFHWIVNLFVEYLPVKEVLLLWDRILGFDSLELLPLLAASIFVFRKVRTMSRDCAGLQSLSPSAGSGSAPAPAPAGE